MLAADERLGVDLVHVLGARRPGGEPAVRRRDLEPADRGAVAVRWTGAGNEDSRAALHGVQPQRFGGGLQLNVHFHTLLLDGVFAAGEDGSLEFHAAEPPSDEEVARLLATIYRRVQRLLARRGLAVHDAPVPGPSRPPVRAACPSAAPPPSLAARALPPHPGLSRRLARPRPGCSQTPAMTVPRDRPRLTHAQNFLDNPSAMALLPPGGNP